MRIYLIAGEVSGDFIGSRIISALKELDPDIEVLGIGGKKMMSNGLDRSLFSMEKISLFGFFEIVPHILSLRRLINSSVQDILKAKPDVLVTIDSPGFCFRVVEQVKLLAPNIKRIHVVAPSVWAYKPERAIKVASLYNQLLTLLPFEAPMFEKYGLKVTYIGHPIFEQDFANIDSQQFKQQHGLDGPIIAVTPGSRVGEIKRHLPIFAQAIAKANFNTCIIVSDNHSQYKIIEKILKNYNLDYFITSDKLQAFKAADLTIAKSGTNTLEIAACNSAMIVNYKLNTLTWWMLRKIIKVKYASLINIIADQEIIPELLQDKCNVENLANYIADLMNSKDKIVKQKEGSQKILKIMGLGSKLRPSQIAAKAIMACVTKTK